MEIKDVIIQVAIVGVLACAVIGTIQNVLSGLKKRDDKNSPH